MNVTEAIKIIEMFVDLDNKVTIDKVKEIMGMIAEDDPDSESNSSLKKTIHEHVGNYRDHNEYQPYINPTLKDLPHDFSQTHYPRDAYGGHTFYC